MKNIFLFFVFILFSFLVVAQEEARLLRFPAIYENQIVFSYAGDLYTVSRSGGTARRLTSDIGYEMFPRFSPDGKNIAFTAQYDGNSEVFMMPAEGGVAKRLTYTTSNPRDDVGDRMGPNNIVMTWTPDGQSVVVRSREHSFCDWIGQLYKVPVNGGMSELMPLPSGGFCSFSADGKKLAYNRVFREFRTWKYYKGGMADDIRVYDFETRQTTNITNNPAQDIFPMWHGNEIYFLSDRDRIMNLFVYNTDTKETRKVTDFKEYDIKFPSIGKNEIVFENAGYIYIYDINSKQIQKVNITITNDLPGGRNTIKDVSKFINSVNFSPDGKRLVVGARGDIFSIPVKEGAILNITHSQGVHDRDAVWSPDGKFIAYVSDKSGEFEIYVENQDGSGEPIQLTKNADTYMYDFKWSPDSKKILWDDKMLRLQYVDINTGKVTLVDKSETDEYSDYNWSPDSKWIAFSHPEKNQYQKIYLYKTETEKKYDVTDSWFDASNPVFSSDSKYLLFISKRDFNPVFSDVEQNIAYKDMSKIYLIPLATSTPSPFAPANDEVNLENKDKKIDAEKQDASKNKENIIDVENISNRIAALPVKASNYFNLNCVNDKVYYNVKDFNDKTLYLKMFDLQTKKETDITENCSFRISANNKKILLVTNDKKYAVVDLPTGKIKPEEFVDLSGLKMSINLHEEWKQIYEECWRQMRDFFYVPNMNGVNWKAVHDKYTVLLPYVNNRSDLNYVIGEMIGELNCGHTYIGGGDVPRKEKNPIGLLGAVFSKSSSGYFKIDKIIKGENSIESLRSPLTERDAKEGEYILAVNGISVKEIKNISEALINTASRKIELTINSTPAEKGSRKIIVVPIADETNLYYYQWVENNIKKVSDATNGEVGYIHVPNMLDDGLNEFMKHYFPQLDKKAIIIDDRYNGGGFVSPIIIERLRRELTRSAMQRNSPNSNTVPRQMILGPKILLVNQYSASDGDLFAYSFRKHNLGKIIGVRTWGGVVGIRNSLPFTDGTDLRKPEFAAYSGEKSEWIIEGYGVEPDITIDNDPAKEFSGDDEQLDKAIEMIKAEIKNYQYLPPIPEMPEKNK